MQLMVSGIFLSTSVPRGSYAFLIFLKVVCISLTSQRVDVLTWAFLCCVEGSQTLGVEDDRCLGIEGGHLWRGGSTTCHAVNAPPVTHIFPHNSCPSGQRIPLDNPRARFGCLSVPRVWEPNFEPTFVMIALMLRLYSRDVTVMSLLCLYHNHKNGLKPSSRGPVRCATRLSFYGGDLVVVFSSDDNSILSEIEAYMGGPSEGFSDEFDSVDHMLEEEANKIPFTGGSVSGFTASTVDAQLAATSGDLDRPFFTADIVASRVRNKDIIRAVKEGCIDGRWFEYLLPDIHFRTSMPPTRYLPVYTRAVTAGMTLPVHPFVKDYCHHYGISPAQLAPNFWYCFAGAWVLWSQRFDMDLLLNEFMFMYKLCHVAKCDGWYFWSGHGRSQPMLGTLIRGLPSSSHGWKPMFFMIRGPFNFHPEDRLPRHRKVQTSFGNMVCHDRPKLSGHRLVRVETTFLYPKKARHIDTLLTKFNLRGAGLILDLLDPSDPLTVREYFHLSDKGTSPAPKERVIMLGAKIMDSNFQVPDISDAEIGAMLKLLPHVSLVFQALYELFLDPHWISAAQSSLVDHQSKQISFQIHGLVLAILNLIDLVKVKECGKETDSVEAKLNSFLDAANKKHMSTVEERDVAVAKIESLERELAKLRSLKNEVASLRAAVEELTRRAEASEKKSA
ncbi:hypothetical protein L484_009239 [Morus notabilis]|uniref:Transposase (putative) gypsy type domain-containing protein n=1 Tax=Morus notabilis TaxID=981085 RepID=W9RV30_9ROSA|nr:hypothetical protein L484_009239 [Morus notabilis]